MAGPSLSIYFFSIYLLTYFLFYINALHMIQNKSVIRTYLAQCKNVLRTILHR